MRKLLISIFVLIFVGASSALLGGCSSSTSTADGQNVMDIAWLPDESGLVAYIERGSISQIDGSQSTTANIYHVSSSGSIGNAIDGSDQAITSDYTPLVFISSDGKSVVTQFGASIFNVNLSSGIATNIIQNTSLYGASTGLHYVFTSQSSSANSTKQLNIYDLTSSPIRLLLPSQSRTSTGNRILWIDSGRYAVTVNDSTGANSVRYTHVAIWDTSGNPILTIPDAGVGLNAASYASGSGELFFTTSELGIDKIKLATGLRTHIITTDSVNSLDVSADGTLLVYSSEETNNNPLFPGYAVNVSNGHRATLTSGGMLAPFISPNADRVAFIHYTGDAYNDQDVNVVAVSLPQ